MLLLFRYGGGGGSSSGGQSGGGGIDPSEGRKPLPESAWRYTAPQKKDGPAPEVRDQRHASSATQETQDTTAALPVTDMAGQPLIGAMVEAYRAAMEIQALQLAQAAELQLQRQLLEALALRDEEEAIFLLLLT